LGPYTTLRFRVPVGSQIVKVLVWRSGPVIGAIQCFTNQGEQSPIMGVRRDGVEPVAYEGHALVGMYGRYGGVIDNIGFRFAEDKSHNMDVKTIYTYGTEFSNLTDGSTCYIKKL